MPETVSDLQLAVYGAIGAIVPDILLLYSKRFTMPAVNFSWPIYAAATILYMGLAAVVAGVYPYGKRRSRLYAIGVGISLPVVLSLLSTAFHTAPLITRGSPPVTGSLLDLLRLW